MRSLETNPIFHYGGLRLSHAIAGIRRRAAIGCHHDGKRRGGAKQSDADGVCAAVRFGSGGLRGGILLFDAVFSAFLLPKNGKRFVYFILNVLLYVLALPLGWLAVTMFVPALGL